MGTRTEKALALLAGALGQTTNDKSDNRANRLPPGQPDATGSDVEISTTALDEAAALHERAAIIAEGTGVPIAWAEGFAALDRSWPVAGFTREQWRQVIDDGGRFLDRWGAEAARLGWRAVDVFGATRSLSANMSPRDEVGQRVGLALMIGGGVVTAIAEDRATVVSPSGSSLTYLRRPVRGAVAIWEIAPPAGTRAA